MDGWRGAGVVLACVVNLFAGCATQAPFRPIADPSATVQGDGFSVRPRGGEHWLLSDSSSGSVIAFGKNDPALFRQGGSVIAVATRERARQGDISTPEGLRAEVDAFVRRHSQSHHCSPTGTQPWTATAYERSRAAKSMATGATPTRCC
jgi:hypothetical protein